MNDFYDLKRFTRFLFKENQTCYSYCPDWGSRICGISICVKLQAV